jgi:hypothetical protein
LIELLVNNFPSFKDISVYKSRNGTNLIDVNNYLVCILKRAQILVADLWACFENETFGKFDDTINTITMFADYRVPQALLHLGLIEYSPELMKIVTGNDETISPGDQKEVEIRCCSIWAVELLRRELTLLGIEMNPILIDFFVSGPSNDLAL